MNLSIVSGSRADWGLLEPLAKLIHDDTETNLQLVITGSHLSHEYGHTVDHIGLPIIATVENVLSADTESGVCKSFGLAATGFADVFKSLDSDAVILLGDRYEILAAAVCAYINRVPICHIHGGEVTAGAYDDAFRHSITKMASLHFVAAEPYRERVIQLGEYPETVFAVGAIGCDGLKKRDQYHKTGYIIVADYPETKGEPNKDLSTYLLKKFDTSKLFFVGGSHDVCASISYGKRELARGYFLSILRFADCIIGNSSAGIIEAPYLGVPTINVGNRQKGRLMADSIIQADPTEESLNAAFGKLYSNEFQEMMRGDYYAPYKGGSVANRIHFIIKERVRRGFNLKKGFYDIIHSEEGGGVEGCY